MGDGKSIYTATGIEYNQDHLAPMRRTSDSRSLRRKDDHSNVPALVGPTQKDPNTRQEDEHQAPRRVEGYHSRVLDHSSCGDPSLELITGQGSPANLSYYHQMRVHQGKAVVASPSQYDGNPLNDDSLRMTFPRDECHYSMCHPSHQQADTTRSYESSTQGLAQSHIDINASMSIGSRQYDPSSDCWQVSSKYSAMEGVPPEASIAFHHSYSSNLDDSNPERGHDDGHYSSDVCLQQLQVKMIQHQSKTRERAKQGVQTSDDGYYVCGTGRPGLYFTEVLTTSLTAILGELSSSSLMSHAEPEGRRNKLMEDNTMSDIMSKFMGEKSPHIYISKYIMRLRKYMWASDQAYIFAVVYLLRIVNNNTDFCILPGMGHRLTLTSFVVAAKYFDDIYYSNEFYARVGGISNDELNSLELELLQLLSYNLVVTAQEYEGARRAMMVFFLSLVRIGDPSLNHMVTHGTLSGMALEIVDEQLRGNKKRDDRDDMHQIVVEVDIKAQPAIFSENDLGNVFRTEHRYYHMAEGAKAILEGIQLCRLLQDCPIDRVDSNLEIMQCRCGCVGAMCASRVSIRRHSYDYFHQLIEQYEDTKRQRGHTLV